MAVVSLKFSRVHQKSTLVASPIRYNYRYILFK